MKKDFLLFKPYIYNGEKVMSLKQFSNVSEIPLDRVRKTIERSRQNSNSNRNMLQGYDFYLLKGSELTVFKASNDDISEYATSLYLLTEKGIDRLIGIYLCNRDYDTLELCSLRLHMVTCLNSNYKEIYVKTKNKGTLSIIIDNIKFKIKNLRIKENLPYINDLNINVASINDLLQYVQVYSTSLKDYKNNLEVIFKTFENRYNLKLNIRVQTLKFERKSCMQDDIDIDKLYIIRNDKILKDRFKIFLFNHLKTYDIYKEFKEGYVNE